MAKTKVRGRNIDDHSIETIVAILDGWAGKLTWELLIDVIAERTRSRYTRQALHMHERVRLAYQLRKTGLASRTPTKTADKLSGLEVEKLTERLDRLTAENVRLKAENEKLFIQFSVWAYNAHSRGLSEAFLSRPLPSIDREQTRKERPALVRKK